MTNIVVWGAYGAIGITGDVGHLWSQRGGPRAKWLKHLQIFDFWRESRQRRPSSGRYRRDRHVCCVAPHNAIALDTLAGLRGEMARLYRLGLNGRIRSDEMTRFVYVLKEIRAALEAETLTDIQPEQERILARHTCRTLRHTCPMRRCERSIRCG